MWWGKVLWLGLWIVALGWSTEASSLLKPQEGGTLDVNTLIRIIESGQYEGIQLGQLYFQLGYLYHHAWLNKLKTGQQNLLLEADHAFEKAIELLKGGPQLNVIVVEVLSMRGVVLKMLGKAEAAMECYDKALSFPLHEADRASLYHCKGDTYLMMDRYREAIEQYEAGLALAPCKTERYHSYVTTLKALNTHSQIDWRALLDRLIGTEKRCHRGSKGKAIKRSKKESSALLLSKFVFDTDFNDRFPDDEDTDLYADEDLAVVMQRNQIPEKPYLFTDVHEGYEPSKKSDMLYAIYIVADIVGERALAWQYLQRANDDEYQQRGIVFDAQQSMLMKNNTVNVFSESFIESFPSLIDYDDLLERLYPSRTLTHREEQRVKDQLAAILAEYHVLTMQEMQRVAIEVLQSRAPPTTTATTTATATATATATVTGETPGPVATSSKDITKLRYIVDKMLFNYRNIGFIHMVFPEAPIIHMVRDPLDTLLSCYRLKFDDIGLHWTLQIPDLVLQFVMYLETMHHFRQVLPDRVLDIRYEELVRTPAPVLKRLFQKTMPGLKYNVDELLKFHENKRAVHTHSQTQVKQSLYSHSIGNWRRYAKELAPMIAEFQKYVPYLDAIGALPFRYQVNWEMRYDFPYEAA
eukprot:gene10063-7190_t